MCGRPDNSNGCDLAQEFPARASVTLLCDSCIPLCTVMPTEQRAPRLTYPSDNRGPVPGVGFFSGSEFQTFRCQRMRWTPSAQSMSGDAASNVSPGSQDPQNPSNHGSINLGPLFQIPGEGPERVLAQADDCGFHFFSVNDHLSSVSEGC